MDRYTNISVIIPTRNRNNLLEKCVLSLFRQSILPREIIIVDNSSKQSAKQLIDHFQNKTLIKIRYFHEIQKGSPYVRNLGIQKASYGILAFIDDDCVADKNWSEEILRSYRLYPNAIIKGKNLNGIGENIYSSVEHFSTELLFSTFLHKHDKITYSYLVDTKNFSIKRSPFLRRKLFYDERFSPFSILDDLDLSIRANQSNLDIIYNDRMIVWHFGRNTLAQHITREINKGRSYFHFYKKWRRDSKENKRLQEYFRYFQKSKQQNIEKRLFRMIVKNNNIFYKIYFKILLLIDKFTIRFGYIIEQIIYVFNN